MAELQIGTRIHMSLFWRSGIVTLLRSHRREFTG